MIQELWLINMKVLFIKKMLLQCNGLINELLKVFPISRVYQAHIPTYPSGHWLFGFASKKYHPIKDFQKTKWNARGMKTKYYNTGIHVGSFALPNYVEELLRDVE